MLCRASNQVLQVFSTYFFPVEDDIRQIIEEWVGFLRNKKLSGNDDPIFPADEEVRNAVRAV